MLNTFVTTIFSFGYKVGGNTSLNIIHLQFVDHTLIVGQ